jgi:hypothetical protein
VAQGWLSWQIICSHWTAAKRRPVLFVPRSPMPSEPASKPQLAGGEGREGSSTAAFRWSVG